MSEQPTSPQELLEFPCQYQFKAIGAAGQEFCDAIVAAVGQHAEVAADAVKSRPSRQGNYQSVSILVTLYNDQQLVRIYADMRQVPQLKMVL